VTRVADARLGIVPIVWNNTDLLDLAPLVPAATVLDEIARLGFVGCQHGRGFPEGRELRAELERRGLRLAERYAALPTHPGGMTAPALGMARDELQRLVEADGEVLIVALDSHPERDPWSGRVPAGAPRWPAEAISALAEMLGQLADEAAEVGRRVAFHPHTATWIEAPDEVDALAAATAGTRAGICLDVGHYVVGGGDPVDAIRRFGDRVTHLHLKDVDGEVLARVRAGRIDGFRQAVRERIFTELGSGLLDVRGVIRALDERGYRGWLMLEQDSTWLRPAESAAMSRRAFESACADGETVAA
jgi:inosose dehydratase